LPDGELSSLRSAFPGCQFHRGREEPDPEWLKLAEVVFADRPLENELLARLERLRWLQITWAAAYRFYRPSLMERPVQITTCRGIHGKTFSEFGLAAIFALAKQLPHCFAAQAARRWEAIVPRDVGGQTLGIVGLGTVGLELAQKASALGMRVVATKRQVGTKPPFVDELGPPEALHELLAQSDFVVLSLPDVAATERFFGEPEFRAMKASAYLINLAPKQAIAEELLIRALKEGWIAGAALDALPREPLPPESELWALPNVLISPRIAGTPMGGRTNWEAIFAIFRDNLSRFLVGERLHNLVDKQLGY
jgi:phosphoglycerate dehydrogenase-like enzyme